MYITDDDGDGVAEEDCATPPPSKSLSIYRYNLTSSHPGMQMICAPPFSPYWIFTQSFSEIRLVVVEKYNVARKETNLSIYIYICIQYTWLINNSELNGPTWTWKWYAHLSHHWIFPQSLIEILSIRTTGNQTWSSRRTTTNKRQE